MTFKFKLNNVENCLRRALLIIADIFNDVKNNENKITNKTFTNIDRFLSSQYINELVSYNSMLENKIRYLNTDENCLYRILDILWYDIKHLDISPKTINNLNRVFNSNQIKDFINNRFARS
jgi:hypothetical protein